MYELCALLRQPKARKVRVQAHKSCRVGAKVKLHGRDAVIVERDPRFKSAWFVEVEGVRSPYSFANTMLVVL